MCPFDSLNLRKISDCRSFSDFENLDHCAGHLATAKLQPDHASLICHEQGALFTALSLSRGEVIKWNSVVLQVEQHAAPRLNAFLLVYAYSAVTQLGQSRKSNPKNRKPESKIRQTESKFFFSPTKVKGSIKMASKYNSFKKGFQYFNSTVV